MGGSSLNFVPICDTVKCIKVPVDIGPNDSLSRTSKNKLENCNMEMYPSQGSVRGKPEVLYLILCYISCQWLRKNVVKFQGSH